MKRRTFPRFDAEARLDRFLEMEALRTTAILARARAEADACMTGEHRGDEPAYLFAEDPYFRH